MAEHVQESMLRTTRPRLRDHDSQEQSPTASEPVQATLKTPLQTSPEGLEARAVLSRFAQQDVDIKKLSRNLESLQDRMLALEKSMIGVRADSRSSSMEGLRGGQDMFIDDFEAMHGDLKDARFVATTMEDLRLENEQLKQKLHSAAAPTVGEVNDLSSKGAADKAAIFPSTAPSLPAKKKRPYTRRKPLASRNSTTPAASGLVDPDSSFASIHDQSHPSQLGSLAALKEITAAMAQAPSASQRRISNDPLDHGFGGHCDQNPENGSLGADLAALSNGDDMMTSQPNKRRRIGGDLMTGGDNPAVSGSGKNEAAHVADLASTSSHPEEPRLKAEFPTLQGTRPHRSIARQLQDVAKTFEIAGTDEMVIDPALRSTCVPADHNSPVPGVLLSIENPPDQGQSRQSSQPRKSSSGTPQYDSEQERRIREYKARDALRKRKSRAASSGKKKMDGEEKFKQEEKIRARDRMVKELMEREEMLEDDGDL